jgi:hypothetical protein
MASQAAGMAGPWGAVAGMGIDMIGQLMGMIKGPKQRREEAAEKKEAGIQKQLGSYKAVAGGAQSANPQAVAGGGTLPMASPPVPVAPVASLPAPPQVQLQQPGPLGGGVVGGPLGGGGALGGVGQGQQRGPLTGQRNDYMMKLLMQGDR